MGARKIQSSENSEGLSHPKPVRRQAGDKAHYATYTTYGLCALYMASKLLEAEGLSKILSWGIYVAPATSFLLAKTWKNSIKFACLSLTAVPLAMGLTTLVSMLPPALTGEPMVAFNRIPELLTVVSLSSLVVLFDSLPFLLLSAAARWLMSSRQ